MTTVKVSLGSCRGQNVPVNDPADSTDNNMVEVELPDGYYRVFSGALKPDDLYLNCLLARDGITQWEPLNQKHLAAKYNEPDGHAGWFTCLIRRGVMVEQPCERCECFKRDFKLRFCWLCIPLAIKEMKGKSSG
jgi:hypothetical protein